MSPHSTLRPPPNSKFFFTTFISATCARCAGLYEPVLMITSGSIELSSVDSTLCEWRNDAFVSFEGEKKKNGSAAQYATHLDMRADIHKRGNLVRGSSRRRMCHLFE